ncbi:MAG: 3-phosphoserine/phosphohydroxythreonine transaminase [Calditrichaeota bacterium]|nr:3-phosphoserine/phosphohydroxythreonine transaminase [Calditrichota bacterium]MCB0316552.1 3-phosphoserine/phosphohydroxythreonine transaminase [Calditrichota bacterium]MCB9087993.1 3-phosphoserine/phosphohydroxythreonine transaminase [Calditrichia bacterium]
MGQRIFNFSAGPATMPVTVLETIQREMLDYKGEGMSIMEMSHRSKTFDAIVVEAEALVREIMGFSDQYQTLFLQGGATGQFAAVPLNLSQPGKVAEYIDSGSWSSKAVKEAEKLGKPFRVTAASKADKYRHIPTDFVVGKDAAYVHITSNNTIYGTQWQNFPDTGSVPLVADMSSDFYCKRFDPNRFGLIYAGAQKNAGPSGVTIIVVRKDLLARSPKDIPTIFNYQINAEKNSLYNTPNTFGIYVVNLVMHWIKNQGGIDQVEKINRQKAKLLYDALDGSDFYRPYADAGSRSLMNVTWNCPSEELEKKFIAEATAAGLSGLKGHRSIGGIRASIYNAMPMAGVERLIEFMRDFEKKS